MWRWEGGDQNKEEGVKEKWHFGLVKVKITFTPTFKKHLDVLGNTVILELVEKISPSYEARASS